MASGLSSGAYGCEVAFAFLENMWNLGVLFLIHLPTAVEQLNISASQLAGNPVVSSCSLALFRVVKWSLAFATAVIAYIWLQFKLLNLTPFV